MSVYALRDGTPDDHAFVRGSWLRSYRDSMLGGAMHQDVYDRGQSRVIAALLARAQLRVACDPNAPTTILGWALLEPATLHYAFIKEPFRGMGIARDLALPAIVGADARYTHKTYDFTHRFRLDGCLFDPFAAMFPRSA